MGKTTELMQLLKTGNSDAARKLIAKMKKSGKKKQLTKELTLPDESSQGQTVMHFCAAQNFVEFIHDLADMGASIDSLDDRGFTPMHLAAGSGRTSAVSALLGKGADPNVASHNGDTPLHLACSGGHASTVEALIAEQANATGFNVSGHTPLDMASQHGHANAVAVLLRSGQFSQNYLQRSDIPHTALLLAAKSGHTEVIGLLVKHGFDINRKLPGANGNCFHEAALYGKVETVKYLLMLGADVQAVNHQGYTALDIVNMYTDPRSAGVMKQVLQDAMAQQARARIAQQAQPSQPHAPHQGHQSHAPHQGHQPHTSHQGHQPHAPHQGHPSQQQYQRHPSQENHYQQPTGRSQQSHSSQGHQPHTTHSGYASHQAKSPPGPSPTPPAGGVPQAGFSYIMPGLVKQQSKPRGDSDPVDPRTIHNNPSPQQGQAYQQQQQQSGYHSQSQAHAAYSQQRSQSVQAQPHSNSPYGQPRSQTHAAAMSQRSQSIQNQPSYDQQRAPQQQQSPYSQHQQYAQQLLQYNQQQQHGHQAGQQQHGQQQQAGQQQHGQQQQAGQQQRSQQQHAQQQHAQQHAQQHHSQQQHAQQHHSQQQHAQQQHGQQQQYSQQAGQQQQYQQAHSAQGTPDTAHRDVGGDTQPMDLASQIKAKLATRKPMATSPTQKDFPPEDDPFRRSNTMTNTSASDIRQVVLKRRGSLTERTSSSPDRDGYDRSNPPTLPRRGHAGPPTFTPIPPSEGEDPASKVATFEKPRRKPQPKPPPQEPEMDNELLKKLMRRQDRMQKAEEEGMESLDPKIDEPVEEEPLKQALPTGPPPIPQRKTAALSGDKELSPPPPPPQTQPPPTTAPPPSQPPPAQPPPAQEPPKSEPAAELPKPKSKPKAKPPPPKPKKEELEVPPWQLELQKRKERRAQESIEIAESMMVESKEETVVETKTVVPPVKEPTPPPPAPPPSQPPPEPVPPPVAEKQEIPPPPVTVKQKPSPTARRKLESKPPVAPPAEPPPPPPPETLPPPTSLPPAPPSVQPPTSVSPSGQNVQSLLPQSLPIASQEKVQSAQSGTPTSELSRSTSLSSLPTTGSPLQISEPIPIGDWLSSYKLSDYASVFMEAGYDTTDFLKGITTDELTEIGMQKPGHKKKIMTALSTVHHKEHLLLEKPASVTAWLTSLGLTEYEEALLDAGYDDIDFISDISSEELQDIGITKKGHLKRFMRGIAELVEVSKSAPPTPSPIPRNQHVNGHATPPPIEDNTRFFEDSKTPEPQDDEKTIIAPPTGFDEPDLKRDSQNLSMPPVASKPKRLSKDEIAMMNSDLSRPRAQSSEREGSVPSDGGLNKMRQLLEQQMGPNRSAESLELSTGSDANEPPLPAKSNSRSPSHSPRIARKQKAAPPPAPKRSSQTHLSSAASLSSSSTSLSSTSETQGYDKRASGDVSQLVESPPKVPTKKRKPNSMVEVTRVPVAGMDVTDLGGEPSSLSTGQKSYSVEDITAALDDMVSEDEFLNVTGPRLDVKSKPVGSEGHAADGVGVGVVTSTTKVGSVNDELDALSKALQGFNNQTMDPTDEDETGEADQLLADIDDMLADLNTKLDFMTPEELGTDV